MTSTAHRLRVRAPMPLVSCVVFMLLRRYATRSRSRGTWNSRFCVSSQKVHIESRLLGKRRITFSSNIAPGISGSVNGQCSTRGNSTADCVKQPCCFGVLSLLEVHAGTAEQDPLDCHVLVLRKGIRCAYQKSGENQKFLHSQNVHGFFCHHVCR